LLIPDYWFRPIDCAHTPKAEFVCAAGNRPLRMIRAS
jgi:hypothetical protein